MTAHVAPSNSVTPVNMLCAPLAKRIPTASFAILSLLISFATYAQGYTFNGRDYWYSTSEGQWYEISEEDTFKVMGTEIIVRFYSWISYSQIDSINLVYSADTIWCESSEDNIYCIHSVSPIQPDPLIFCGYYLSASMTEWTFNNTESKPLAIPDEAEGEYYNSQIYLADDEDPFDDINVERAWDFTTGDPEIKIGLIDNGFLWQHPELGGNCWRNDGEDLNHDGVLIYEPDFEWTNGVFGRWVFDPDDIAQNNDDDRNGYRNDLIGASIPNRNGDVGSWQPQHGTLCATIIGARSNNGSQFAGIAGGWGDAPGVSLIFTSVGVGDAAGTRSAIRYLIRNGARIITYSRSNAVNSLNDVLQETYDAGILFVSASGNSDRDRIIYPASHWTALSVGASYNNARAFFSNYSASLKLVGPAGANEELNDFLVYCASCYNNEDTWTPVNPDNALEDCRNLGTSFSTPMVAGVAGLLLSQTPELTRNELFEILCTTTNKIDGEGIDYNFQSTYGMRDSEVGYGQVDAGQAVEYGRKQTIHLVSGWQNISTYLEVFYNETDNAVNLLFSEINANIIQVKDFDGNTYAPGNCAIDPFISSKGYKAKMSAECDLIVLGRRIIPEDEPIDLNVGWNWVSYYPGSSMDEFDAFESLLNPRTLYLAKNSAGNFMVWLDDHWFSNIPSLMPGEGYELDMDFEDELVYPNVDLDGFIDEVADGGVDIESEPMHYNLCSRSLLFKPILYENLHIENVRITENDELGAFRSNGLCVGATRIQDVSEIGLSVWVDDPTTEEIDGWITGDTLFIQYWQAVSNSTFPLDTILLDGPGRDSYPRSDLIIRRIDLKDPKFSPTYFTLNQNYPNPFNHSTQITFFVPNAGAANIAIFDALGRMVKEWRYYRISAGGHSIHWDGSNIHAQELTSGLYIVQINFVDLDGGQRTAKVKTLLLR